MRRFVNGITVPILLVSGLLLAGCGGEARYKVVKVAGTVLLDDKPHGPARLTFTPVSASQEDKRSTVGGEVDASGKFTLTTYDKGDGAPPGKYTVTLSEAVSDAGSADPSAMMKMMAGGVPSDPLTIDIPDAPTENLELKFVSKKGGPTGTSPAAPGMTGTGTGP